MTLDVVIFGLTMSSSWGNGHSVTYRALIKALAKRGHRVTFIERDVPWYRAHRDLVCPDYCTIAFYDSLKDVPARFGQIIADADLVMMGSFVPDGIALADWITNRARGVTAFYDIDTPATLAGLQNGTTEYITAALIPRFDLYLSFTGGLVPQIIEDVYGSPRSRALYCTADPALHHMRRQTPRWHLGYLGTYSEDRQNSLETLLLEPARRLSGARFCVAGPQYPARIAWPANVDRIDHVPPGDHASFYGRQKYTLNLTRADMIGVGYSPSVRLFEAAACGVPIISDRWDGIETFFKPDEEILLVSTGADVVSILSDLTEDRRLSIAAAARNRFQKEHTPAARARQLEDYVADACETKRGAAKPELSAIGGAHEHLGARHA